MSVQKVSYSWLHLRGRCCLHPVHTPLAGRTFPSSLTPSDKIPVCILLHNRLYSGCGILRNMPQKEKVDAHEICRGQPQRTQVLGSHEPDRSRVSADIAGLG